MTKKIIFRDQFSWKVRTFAQNLCENGLHLSKERALCTRFAPSLSLEIVLNIISHDNSRTQNIHYGGA